jgi:hypothetical protein
MFGLVLGRAREARGSLWTYVVVSAPALAAAEVAFRLAYGWPSPIMGLAYGLAALAVGHATLGALATRAPLALRFVVGAVVICAAYAIACALHAPGALAIVVGPAAAVGAVRLGRSGLLARRVGLGDVVAAVGVAALAARAVWFADRLQLFAPHPTSFGWIDTPFWLSLAHGADRGVPIPDLLFHGGRANYYFGAFVLVAAVRRLTGLPMHVAYFVTMLSSLLATTALFSAGLRAWFGVRRAGPVAGAMTGLSTLVWVELFTQNASTMVALPVTLSALLLVTRARSWSHLALVLVLVAAVAVTKEVQLVAVLLLGAVVAAGRWSRTRARGPMVAVVASAVVAKVLQLAVLRPDQRVALALNHENLSGEVVTVVLKEAAPFVTLGLAAALALVRFRHRLPGFAQAVVAASACYAVGLAIWLCVLPVVTPPLDPFSKGWLRLDVFQFVHFGRQAMLAAIGLAAIAAWLRFAAARAGRASTAVLLGGLALTAVFSMWRGPPRGEPDPIVPVLEQVPPRASVIAADHLHWNGENPHWAAYFGHQFFVMRTGRWVTAYPHFARATEEQRVLFSTRDPAEALRIARERGITHLIEDRGRPVPWLAGRPAAFETPAYRLHVLAPR